MTINLGYMGTKKFLAPQVRDVINACVDGIVVDVFAGMGSVGEMLADTRALWVNDIQIFAADVGRARFLSRHGAPPQVAIHKHLVDAYQENLGALSKRFSSIALAEAEALASQQIGPMKAINKEIVKATSTPAVLAECKRRAKRKLSAPYCLFSLSYSGRFFSLMQAMQIDSLRFAIDSICEDSEERERWLILALGIAIIRVASSTGHFAQYLSPKKNNIRFLRMQRRRDVLETFWSELAGLAPVGSRQWRRGNRAFNMDATDLLRYMRLSDVRPAVVYADPPYTDDQYSRYYHLWETLVLYDYPSSSGKGCYRPDRFHTPFARKSQVIGALDDLAAASSALGAELVLSYPANGLLSTIPCKVETILRRHFRYAQCVVKTKHEHSTMGASTGQAKQSVKEMIFVARN